MDYQAYSLLASVLLGTIAESRLCSTTSIGFPMVFLADRA